LTDTHFEAHPIPHPANTADTGLGVNHLNHCRGQGMRGATPLYPEVYIALAI